MTNTMDKLNEMAVEYATFVKENMVSVVSFIMQSEEELTDDVCKHDESKEDFLYECAALWHLQLSMINIRHMEPSNVTSDVFYDD